MDVMDDMDNMDDMDAWVSCPTGKPGESQVF